MARWFLFAFILLFLRDKHYSTVTLVRRKQAIIRREPEKCWNSIHFEIISIFFFRFYFCQRKQISLQWKLFILERCIWNLSIYTFRSLHKFTRTHSPDEKLRKRITNNFIQKKSDEYNRIKWSNWQRENIERVYTRHRQKLHWNWKYLFFVVVVAAIAGLNSSRFGYTLHTEAREERKKKTAAKLASWLTESDANDWSPAHATEWASEKHENSIFV